MLKNCQNKLKNQLIYNIVQKKKKLFKKAY